MTNPKSKIQNPKSQIENPNPKFAIFITSYNYAEFIGPAIESVINQTDPNWHLYIFDNCSTDNTFEIVKKYLEKDSRISWIQREKNIGSIPNIINAFREIDADLISSLCADDWLEKNFVADAKKAFAENPEIPFCAFGNVAVYFDENLQQFRGIKDRIPVPENFQNKIFISPLLAFGNIISLNVLVFKKNLLLEVLPKIENAKLLQFIESLMMQTLEEKHGASFLNINTHGYGRVHDKQITQKQRKNFQVAIETLTEPFFHCQDQNQNQNQNLPSKIQICNRFISVISMLLNTKMPYCQASNWLLSDLGRSFLEKFANFEISQIGEKSLFCVAICSFALHIYFGNFAGFNVEIKQAKSDLFAWFDEIKQKFPELKTFSDCFAVANEIYNGFFMSENAIKKLEKMIKKDRWLK